MVLILNNTTAGTLTYLSGTVSVTAGGSTNVTDLTEQIYLSIDGQLKSDITKGYIQISDNINTYATNDALEYLEGLIKNINPINVSETSVYTRAGQMFSLATNVQFPGTISETPIVYLSNPGGSGKIMRIKEVSLDSPIFVGDAIIYRFYASPTITVNGTPITPIGSRVTGQITTSLNAYLFPTASSNGFFTAAKVVSFGSDVIVDYDFGGYIEPGVSLLITAQLSQSNGSCGLFIRYAEEV